MVTDAVDLRATIARALNEAQSGKVTAETLGKRHRKRSRDWVEALGSALRQCYGAGCCVFTKHYGDNRQRFGLNELLYDICVCRTGEVIAGRSSRKYITKCLWQIESEFSRSVGEALKDFNKLVLGSAENKLFIGPLSEKWNAMLTALKAPAEHCTGTVYVSLIPHPSSWPTTCGVRTWSWNGSDWIEFT